MEIINLMNNRLYRYSNIFILTYNDHQADGLKIRLL